jgi:hypothetical protein
MKPGPHVVTLAATRSLPCYRYARACSPRSPLPSCSSSPPRTATYSANWTSFGTPEACVARVGTIRGLNRKEVTEGRANSSPWLEIRRALRVASLGSQLRWVNPIPLSLVPCDGIAPSRIKRRALNHRVRGYGDGARRGLARAAVALRQSWVGGFRPLDEQSVARIRSRLPFRSSRSAASILDLAIVIRFSYFKSDVLAVNQTSVRACRFNLGWI